MSPEDHTAALADAVWWAVRASTDGVAVFDADCRIRFVRLHGVVDVTAERRLRTEILGAARDGAVPVVIDLDGVTLLASAGIRVLHVLPGPLDLRLRATAGTPARAVLELTGLAGQLQPAESLAGA